MHDGSAAGLCHVCNTCLAVTQKVTCIADTQLLLHVAVQFPSQSYVCRRGRVDRRWPFTPCLSMRCGSTTPTQQAGTSSTTKGWVPRHERRPKSTLLTLRSTVRPLFGQVQRLTDILCPPICVHGLICRPCGHSETGDSCASVPVAAGAHQLPIPDNCCSSRCVNVAFTGTEMCLASDAQHVTACCLKKRKLQCSLTGLAFQHHMRHSPSPLYTCMQTLQPSASQHCVISAAPDCHLVLATVIPCCCLTLQGSILSLGWQQFQQMLQAT